jgi:hypothetical protein
MTMQRQYKTDCPWQKRSYARVMLAVLMLLLAAAQQSLAQEVFCAGEKLRYKVRWSFIRLGTLEVQQCATDSLRPGERRFTLSAKSAAGLPFIDVDIEQTAVATLDASGFETVSVETRCGDHSKTVYLVERAAGRMIVVDSADGVFAKIDTVTIAERCYEAIGLLLVARMQASKNVTIVVPTIVDRSIGETILECSGKTEPIEVSAVDEPLEAFYVTGDARWVGSSFGGMKGQFCGWISRDEAAIPLRAELGIMLGSIVLELESIERPQWQPAGAAVLAGH